MLKNYPIKELQKHFSNRFMKAVELWQAKMLTDEDIHLLVKNEPTVSYVIQFIKDQQREQEHKNAYAALKDKLLIDQFINQIQAQRNLHHNEFSKWLMFEPSTPEQAEEKRSQLNVIAKRIKECDSMLEDITKIKNNTQKTKRGRPKKEEDKSILEISAAVKEDYILALVDALNFKQKQALVFYLQQQVAQENKSEDVMPDVSNFE